MRKKEIRRGDFRESGQEEATRTEEETSRGKETTERNKERRGVSCSSLTVNNHQGGLTSLKV